MENPFDISVAVTRNIVFGEKMDDELVEFKTNCLVTGEKECQKFKDKRLEKKVIKLSGPITKLKVKSCSSLTQRYQKPQDIKKRMVQLMRNIDIIRMRDYDLKELL